MIGDKTGYGVLGREREVRIGVWASGAEAGTRKTKQIASCSTASSARLVRDCDDDDDACDEIGDRQMRETSCASLPPSSSADARASAAVELEAQPAREADTPGPMTDRLGAEEGDWSGTAIDGRSEERGRMMWADAGEPAPGAGWAVARLWAQGQVGQRDMERARSLVLFGRRGTLLRLAVSGGQ